MAGHVFRPSSPMPPGTTALSSALWKETSSHCWCLKPETAGITVKTRRTECKYLMLNITIKVAQGYCREKKFLWWKWVLKWIDEPENLFQMPCCMCLIRRGWFPFSYTRVIPEPDSNKLHVRWVCRNINEFTKALSMSKCHVILCWLNLWSAIRELRSWAE